MADTKAVVGTLAVPVLMGAAALMLPFFIIAGAAGAAPDPLGLCGSGGTAQTVSGVSLSVEQMGNAQTIVTTVASMHAPAYAATVALATAYQESKLINSAAQLDHDSEGLFQQRVSIYTAHVAIDPVKATEAFVTRLLGVPNWQTIPLTQAAQTVQLSAFPNAYTGWQPLADTLTGQLWPAAAAAAAGATPASPVPGPVASAVASPTAVSVPPVACTDRGGAGGSNIAGNTTVPAGLVVDGSPAAQIAVAFAIAQLGKPYVFGAAGPDAYDCSGLVMVAWAQAGVALPHYTVSQLGHGTPEPTDLSQAVAGDLVFIPGSDGTAAAPGHVGMVVGHVGTRTYLIQAPMTGLSVEISDAANWAGSVVDVRHIG
jgi:cell wall-associated NlpC family hydrolase